MSKDQKISALTFRFARPLCTRSAKFTQYFDAVNKVALTMPPTVPSLAVCSSSRIFLKIGLISSTLLPLASHDFSLLAFPGLFPSKKYATSLSALSNLQLRLFSTTTTSSNPAFSMPFFTSCGSVQAGSMIMKSSNSGSSFLHAVSHGKVIEPWLSPSCWPKHAASFGDPVHFLCDQFWVGCQTNHECGECVCE